MAPGQAERKGLEAAGLVAASLLAVAAALAGCQMPRRQPGPLQAAPRLEPGQGFFLNQDGDTISLAYGRANSDDVVLMLQCQKGARDIRILDVVHGAQARGPAVLTLISGAARSDLKAQVAPDETGQTLASSHAPSALPALTGFRHSGAISIKLGGRLYALTATPGEMIGVARFFAACG